MKKISVLIPAHNEEKYIGKCLDSLQKLSYPIHEIIVCDNNCTDNTCAIVATYQNVRLVHETKVGPNAARQKAFDVSTGEIVVTLDADCEVPKDWTTHAIRRFDDPSVIAVAGVCSFDGGRFLAHILFIATNYVIAFLHFITHTILKKYAIMLASNAWFRRDALIAIGGFNTDIEFFGDDAHTGKMLSKIGKVVYDPRVTVTTSSRRFNQEGTLAVMYRYAMNYLSMWTRNKPLSSPENTHHYR